MLVSEKMLNEFYQGLKLLIEFETGQSRGAMSSPFYAINKVVAHFNTALDEGDVIAPFFLHYLADKFSVYVDKLMLPDLSSVPTHKSKAPIWIKDYQNFLVLYEKIDKITKPGVIECKSAKQAEMNQNNMLRQLQRVQKEVACLITSPSELGGVLAAKLLEYLQEKTNNNQLNQLSVRAFETSAFCPNVYAMYEYARFLHKNNMRIASSEKQEKLETELNLLAKRNGDISILVEHYRTNRNDRCFSQWLFQSAIHGKVDLAKFMLEQYIFNDDFQWHDKISDKDKLVEAIKWFNWHEEHAPLSAIHAHWREITDLATRYREVIGSNKYKASFLCYALDRINQEINAQLTTMDYAEVVSQNRDLAYGFQNFKEIIDLTWSFNNRQLPSESSPIVITEMATILEARHEYTGAERLYRQAYALEGSHPVHQYNLANILSLQNINKTEQINLYFDAAQQGCYDSVEYLFKVLVVGGDGSVEQLEKLKHVVESHDFDMDLPVPASLFINLITVTLFQKLTNTTLIQWSTIESEGKQFSSVTFIYEKECLDNDNSGSKSPDNSPVEAIASSSIEATSIPTITTVQKLKEQCNQEHKATSSPRLFQPAKNETMRDSKKERALRKLHDLNSKPTKTLSLNDFIEAKKAYQILMGETGGIEISHKGKTSGSRIRIGTMNMHLTHGRDRMSIGAQSEIKEAINEFCRMDNPI